MKKDEMSPGNHLAAEVLQYSPLNNEPESHHQAGGYGDIHLQGNRPSQEDGGLFVQLNSAVELSPAQVAERMWTALKNVDDLVKQQETNQPQMKNQGTTACIASVHQKHLITANLADSVLFAVLYSPEGKVIGATRVTQDLHKPTQKNERARIESQGGKVFFGRVNGSLAVARAIGDHQHNTYGEVVSEVISSDASLGIYSLDEMQKALNPKGLAVGKMQFIMTCDGVTEPAENSLDIEHHTYLYQCLDAINNGQPGNLPESELARLLAEQAIADGSGDNVSASVMTYNPQNTNTSYFAIFDGHGGQRVVHEVVQNFANSLNQQLTMTENVYQQQAQSVQNKQANFLRDNAEIFKTISASSVQLAPEAQSQTTTTTVAPTVQSQTTTTTVVPTAQSQTLTTTAENDSLAKRKAIEGKAHQLLAAGQADKIIFKNLNYIAGNAEHNQKQPLGLVQFIFANQEKQEKFKILAEQLSKTKVAYCGKANLNPYVVELLPAVVATMDLAALQPAKAPEQMVVEQVPAQKKGITNSQAELQALMKLLNLSDNFTLGEAIDDGGCFFDSLAQTLNQLGNTDIYSENYLRLLCQEYFFANKAEVNAWNKADNGLELGDDYAFVKYNKAQLEADFYGRSPIWGRPSVEGKILCRKLNLDALYVVELIIDPDNGSLIPAVFKATKTGYTQLSGLPQDVIGKEPVLLVHQGKLHFVPLLSQVKPSHGKDKDKELPKKAVVQTTTTTTATVASQKKGYELKISRHPTDNKKVLVKASVTPAIERKPQHVVFVLDRSGSMKYYGAIEMVKEATKQLVRKALHPDDSFSVIVYDGKPEVLVAKTKQSEAQAALKKISQISTGGGTEIQKGLALIGNGGSYPVQVDDVANTSIVLLTDGENGTTITAENEVELLKQRLGSDIAPIIVSMGVGRHYKPQFLAGFGKLTGLDTTIHISNGNSMAAGFNTAAKFINPHLAESTELKLSVTADNFASEQAQNLGVLFVDEPGTYVFELDQMPNEVTLALTSTFDNKQLSTMQNLSEIARVDRDIVALYANQLLLQKDEVPYVDWKTYDAHKKQRAVELEREILSLLSPAYASDSDLVKRVRSNLVTIIKSLYGVLEDDNQAKAAKSDSGTTSVSSGVIAEYVKFGLTGLDNYNPETKSLALEENEYRLAGSDIDYVKSQNPYLISFSAAFSKDHAVLIDQNSPVIQAKLKSLGGAIKGKITAQGKLETVAEQVKSTFTRSKIHTWSYHSKQSLQLGGNYIACIPFEDFVNTAEGESRHQSLLSAQFVADLVKKGQLANGSVRQFFGISEDGQTAHSWLSYHPQGSDSLFIIDPSNHPSVYDLSTPTAVIKARRDYAARGLAGVLDGCLATYKKLKLEEQDPISDNLLGSIADEQIFQDKGYVDPISLEVMAKPVRIKGQPEQQVFDEASLKAWFTSCGAHPINPLTRQPCSTELVPAIDIRDRIIFEIQSQNNAIPSEKVIEMSENRKQKQSKALSNGIYALKYAVDNGIAYSAEDLIPQSKSDTATVALPFFTKPDLTAIYQKFSGVRAAVGAASLMLVSPGQELPATGEIPLVQLGYSDTDEVQLQLSFRNEKDAVALASLLNGEGYETIGIDRTVINNPQYGSFNATVVIGGKEIKPYLEDLVGITKHDMAFLFRIVGLGGHYCQLYLDSARLDGLEAALRGFQEGKSKAEGSLGIISSYLSATFLAPPTVSVVEQAEIATTLLSIIAQVRENEGTALYERSSSKPVLELLRPDSALKNALKDYMDLVIALVCSSQYVPASAPTLAV
ncbi:cobaltochelatase subunit [Legionella massiliensis]|uniref:Cobaltochelatase subunit n=1 Tax=Legionella massiliensis TaxID=1034943 RepID=A0A078KQC0_9GAMM|nr:VWA domain-containing protein [Legionella massiliensis]CDZ76580.1 cobaltochelatase subunit [Legionella massiliensis]CEE12318.1 Protein phosphatase 2C [Legionella massiliensis]